jgi:hypothetical protein
VIQYGLRNAAGKFLPRDAYKRGMLKQRLDTPDLWHDKERAELYASQYSCEVVEFVVEPAVVQNNVKEAE